VEQKDRKEFAKIMTLLNELFGDSEKPVNDIKLDFYFKAFSDVTLKQFNDMALALANTKKFKSFPTPAEIREASEGDAEFNAITAINKLEDAIDRIGGYTSVQFDDPVLHAVIEEYGGWPLVSDSREFPIDEWKRKELIKVYQGFARRGTQNVPDRLLGLKELSYKAREEEYVQKGLVYEGRTALVGDYEKAFEWTKKLSSVKKAPLELAVGVKQ